VKGTVHCFTLDEVHIEEYEGKNGKGTKLVGRVTDVELGPRVGDAPAGGAQPQRENQMPPQGGRQSTAPQNQGFDDDDIPF
jgi:hypothetical protein